MSQPPTSPKSNSQSNLSHNKVISLSQDPNVTIRNKRKGGELSDDSTNTLMDFRNILDELKTQQEAKYDSLKTTMEAILEQNTDIKKSIEVMSDKYDDILRDMKRVQLQNDQYKTYIKTLETKLEFLETNSRATSVELRNVPLQETENKASLVEVARKICSTVDLSVQDSDIRDVFRMKLKDKLNGPIVINFTSTIKKEGFLKSARNFNKTKEPKHRLSTTSAGIAGPTTPIYVSELLTPKAKKLHYLARVFARDNNYVSCWTEYGKVYLKHIKNGPRLRIDSEADLENLKEK